MTVGVIFVSVLFAVVAGKQNDEVRNEAGRGGNAVGKQCLGLGKDADNDLCSAQ